MLNVLADEHSLTAPTSCVHVSALNPRRNQTLPDLAVALNGPARLTSSCFQIKKRSSGAIDYEFVPGESSQLFPPFNANKTLTFPAFYVSRPLIKQAQTTSLARESILN